MIVRLKMGWASHIDGFQGYIGGLQWIFQKNKINLFDHCYHPKRRMSGIVGSKLDTIKRSWV